MHDAIYFATVICIYAALAISLSVRRIPSKSMIVFFAILTVVLATVNYRIGWTSTPFYDFTYVYYQSGVAALHHDFSSLRRLTGNGTLGFVNIPIVAYWFFPFALVGPTAAAILFTLIGMISIIFSWFFLTRSAQLDQKESYILAFLFLVNGPLINGIKFGNASYFILFSLSAGLTLINNKKSGAAGILLGLSAILKPPLLLFGVYFVLRRDVRGVIGFTSACAITSLLSLAVFGWANNIYWFEACILQFSHSWLTAFNLQSLVAFIYRLNAPYAVLVNWDPHTPSDWQSIVARISSGLIFATAAIAVLMRPAPTRALKISALTRDNLSYFLTISLCLVASPLSWSHYYSWLLVPTAFFLKSAAELPTRARYLGWMAIGLVTLPVVWPASFSNPWAMRLYSSLIVSHLLLGGLLWFGLIAWALARSRTPADFAPAVNMAIK